MKASSVVIPVVVVAAVLTLASASPAAPNKSRTIRGFKNAALSTARGFGKRGSLERILDSSTDTNTADLFGSVHNERQDIESLPVEFFSEELAGNPELARLVVSRFIDRNQDGELTPDELLRSFY